MIAAGIVTVAWTSSVLVMFGRMWRKMIVTSLAPFATAARTKSSSRSASVSPRAIRMKPGAAPIAERDRRVQERRPEDRRQADREDQEREGEQRRP